MTAQPAYKQNFFYMFRFGFAGIIVIVTPMLYVDYYGVTNITGDNRVVFYIPLTIGLPLTVFGAIWFFREMLRSLE